MHITCCLNCQDRHLGCHSTCEKYIKQSEENAKLNEKIRRDKQNKAFSDSLTIKRIDRYNKRIKK